MSRLLALLVVLLTVTQAAAGNWTSNNFFYKPDVGARGEQEKTNFDSGLERVDTRLGNERWLNDQTLGGTLQAAVTAIGSTATVLNIPPGTWPMAADLTVPANITLKVLRGAAVSIATGQTLSIKGGLEAGPYPIFACAGTGKVAFIGGNDGGVVPLVRPEWWGAVPDGSTDSTAAVKAACSSLPVNGGGVIDFGVGTYSITPGQVVITTPGTILQGQAAATNGFGAYLGTTLKSRPGTGKLISFIGNAANTTLDSCQLNDMTLWGNNGTVQGLSLKWIANFRSRNAYILGCLDHGVYMEQVWDSSFYDLEIEWCGSQANNKAGLFIYNGANDNSNNLRFYAFHAETNYGNDVWIDASGIGGDNYNILFDGGKCEKSQSAGSFSKKAFYLTGWNGSTGKVNQHIVIRNMGIYQYMQAGDIGIHFAGAGYMVVDNCNYLNNVSGGTGIKIEGPVLGNHTHRILGNLFAQVAQEITIDPTCPRDAVWTDGNRNGLWNATDRRIHINTPLVKDHRRLVLASEGANHQTASTAETDLASCTLPANLLSTYGGIKVRASGWSEGAAGNKTVKLYFGSHSVTVCPPGALADWQLEASIRIMNGVSNSINVDWKFWKNGSPATISSGMTAFAEATTVDVPVKLTGQCANGADIVHQSTWVVEEE